MTQAADWLRRPIAHRGLHEVASGIVENTGSAFRAAMERGFGIETDLRLAACGTAMAFHDERLDRLTGAAGLFLDKTANELRAIAFRQTTDRMMSLPELLSFVDSRVPLLLELKSDWRETPGLVDAVIADLREYRGDFALMSFDPKLVLQIKEKAPAYPRGLVAERRYHPQHYPHLTDRQRDELAQLASLPDIEPAFISYNVDELPAPVLAKARARYGCLIQCWTVCTQAQRQQAEKYADGYTFEGFIPA